MSLLRPSDIVDKTVIDSAGKQVGVVRDVAFSLDGTLAFVLAAGAETRLLPLAAIVALGDVILVKPDAARAAPAEASPPAAATAEPPRAVPVAQTRPAAAAASGVACAKCGRANPSGKFCVGCGAKLAVA